VHNVLDLVRGPLIVSPKGWTLARRAASRGLGAACWFAALVALAAPCFSQPPLPPPTDANRLRVFIHDPGLDVPELTLAGKTSRLRQMVDRLAPADLYVRVGVAIPYRATAHEVFQAAAEARVPVAVFGGPAPHHTDTWLSAAAEADPRNLEWLSDGTLGLGADRGRTWASPSVYAQPVVAARDAASDAMASRMLAVDRELPGVISLLAGPQDVCLSVAGYPSASADYAPWTIAQFRDWLTHRGAYAPGAILAGRGHPDGAAWSDAPTPNDPAGTGRSLNETFGTTFTTWALRYWDPPTFHDGPPAGAPLMPREGLAGHTRGGFDAPRERSASPALWEAWLRFREQLVRDWRMRHIAIAERAGMPGRMLAACSPVRDDPTWTEMAALSLPGEDDREAAHLVLLDGPPVGVVAAARALPEGCRWGAVLDVPTEVDTAWWTADDVRDWLRPCLDAGCSVLIIRAWDQASGGNGIVAGTVVEAGVRGVLADRDDRPLGAPPDAEFAPPAVTGITVSRQADGNRITWSSMVFPGSLARWEDWRPFLEFAVSRMRPTPVLVGATRDYGIADVGAPDGAEYEVRARCRTR
jgi:hypothetical protein